MPLVTAPPFALNSQYRPNKFLVSMTSANALVLAQASIVVDSVGVTSMSKSPLYFIGTTYYFEFDVAKVLQTYSAPKSTAKTTVFPDTLGVPLNVSNTDCHTQVGLIISYLYNDPVTGLLTQFITTDIISTGYPATNGTRQTRNFAAMGMDAYSMVTGSAATPFLTNFPNVIGNPYPICSNENHYISFIPNLCNAVRIETVDSGGVLIDSGLFSITPNANLIPTTIGVGMINLATQVYFDGSVNMSDPNLAEYRVYVGNAYLIGGNWLFVQASESRVFKKIECCAERSTRLHWLNRLGGADAYTFSSKKTIKQKNKSELAQVPQTWTYNTPPTTIYDRGLFKIAQDVSVEYEVESKFYTEAEGLWIAELLSSPEVYLETSDGLVAVVITDSSITTSENNELLNVTINFVESNNISVQQN
jgi:hypothetical protein